jgi:hypothetical protein
MTDREVSVDQPTGSEINCGEKTRLRVGVRVIRLVRVTGADHVGKESGVVSSDVCADRKMDCLRFQRTRSRSDEWISGKDDDDGWMDDG